MADDPMKILHKEIMRLIRKDFDPTPPNWDGPEWFDNAEDVANSIIAASPIEALMADNARLREALQDTLPHLDESSRFHRDMQASPYKITAIDIAANRARAALERERDAAEQNNLAAYIDVGQSSYASGREVGIREAAKIAEEEWNETDNEWEGGCAYRILRAILALIDKPQE